jgi:hypothetical protein
MTTSQAFAWCRIRRRVSLLVLSPSDQRLQRRPRAKGGVFAFAPTPTPHRLVSIDCVVIESVLLRPPNSFKLEIRTESSVAGSDFSDGVAAADPLLTVAVANCYTNLGKKLPSRLAIIRRLFETLRGGAWGSGAPVASAPARSAAARRALLAVAHRRVGDRLMAV